MLQRTFSRALPRLAHHILYLPRPAAHLYRPTADCIFHFTPGSWRYYPLPPYFWYDFIHQAVAILLPRERDGADNRARSLARSLPRRMSQNERFNPDNWIRSNFFGAIHTRFASVSARVSYRFLSSRCVYCIFARVQLRKLLDEGLRLFVSGSRPLPV